MVGMLGPMANMIIRSVIVVEARVVVVGGRGVQQAVPAGGRSNLVGAASSSSPTVVLRMEWQR